MYLLGQVRDLVSQKTEIKVSNNENSILIGPLLPYSISIGETHWEHAPKNAKHPISELLLEYFTYSPIHTIMVLEHPVPPANIVEEYWVQLVGFFGSEELAFVAGTCLVHGLIYVVCNLWLALLYHFEWPFFEKYRIQVRGILSGWE